MVFYGEEIFLDVFRHHAFRKNNAIVYTLKPLSKQLVFPLYLYTIRYTVYTVYTIAAYTMRTV